MIEPVAPAHHVPAGDGKIDRRRDGGGGGKRRGRALLAEIFQQHRTAQRVTDGHDATARQFVGQQGQQRAEILAAPGVVMLAAQRPRRPRPAQVEPQHRAATIEQQARHRKDVETVGEAGEPVDQDGEWAPARGSAGRSRLAKSVSPVPSASAKLSRSLACGASDVETPRSRLAMVCRSPPHQGKRGRKGGRSELTLPV